MRNYSFFALVTASALLLTGCGSAENEVLYEAYVSVPETQDYVRLFAEADSSSTELARMHLNDTVSVLKKKDGWAYVDYETMVGYVQELYLSETMIIRDENDEKHEEDEEDVTETTATSATTAQTTEKRTTVTTETTTESTTTATTTAAPETDPPATATNPPATQTNPPATETEPRPLPITHSYMEQERVNDGGLYNYYLYVDGDYDFYTADFSMVPFTGDPTSPPQQVTNHFRSSGNRICVYSAASGEGPMTVTVIPYWNDGTAGDIETVRYEPYF